MSLVTVRPTSELVALPRSDPGEARLRRWIGRSVRHQVPLDLFTRTFTVSCDQEGEPFQLRFDEDGVMQGAEVTIEPVARARRRRGGLSVRTWQGHVVGAPGSIVVLEVAFVRVVVTRVREWVDESSGQLKRLPDVGPPIQPTLAEMLME